MLRRLPILAAPLLLVALPLLLRHDAAPAADDGGLVLVVVTPHNEALRHEFGRAFARWHEARYGTAVRLDWRAVGGTSEISRYLTAEYAAAMRAHWRSQGRAWPSGAGDTVTAPTPPADPALREVYQALRTVDDPDSLVNCGMDVFFGGGAFDHADAYARGLTVAPWATGTEPPGLLTTPEGLELIPAQIGGETWRTASFFGSAVSTFGICWNLDRIAELGTRPPAAWDDLADPVYFRQIAVADPDKSGSVAKAFEMMIHQKVRQAVERSGYTAADTARFEAAIAAMAARGDYRRGELPPEVPAAYQAAVEAGWIQGLHLVQRIGANARYFTDSASKVAVDVAVGDAAAGMVIDFYGRFQAEYARTPDGRVHMAYRAPPGGSSVSCDPVSLLRGAGAHAPPALRRQTREVAVRFIEFVLGEAGQKLWTYRPGTPGGPERYALRRLPIRRDFYPSTHPAVQAAHLSHLPYAADDLADPEIDPYRLAESFTYYPRWTSGHFNVQRRLIRAMCIDAGPELQAAWAAIHDPANTPRRAAALELLGRLPEITLTNRVTGAREPVALTWSGAPDILRRYDPLEVMAAWTAFFQRSYREARGVAQGR